MKPSTSNSVWLAALLFVYGSAQSACSDADEPDPQDTGGETISDLFEVSPGASRGSCMSQGQCVDYVGSMWTPSEMTSNCGQVPGSTFSDDPCPVESRVGSCAVNVGGPGEFVSRYYSPTFTASTAAMLCGNSGGTWIP